MSKVPQIELTVYGRTDVGLIREHNEDNFLLANLDSGERSSETTSEANFALGDRGALFVVADGMGGAAAGEVASQVAVDSISASMLTEKPTDRHSFAGKLRRSIEDANDKIYAQSRDNQNERGMGTTVTVAGLCDDTLILGQIGDSRAYIMRNGRLAQVTKDQSLAWQLIEAGAMTIEEAKAFEHANIILQALGVQERVDVVLSQAALKNGDLILISSDGLHGPVTDEEISEILNSQQELRSAGDQLIARALEREGPDNITVVLIRVGGQLNEPGPADLVEFVPYTAPEDERTTSSRQTPENSEAATREVKMRADVSGAHAAITASDMPVLESLETAEMVPAKNSRSVLVFAAIALALALAAGLFLRFDRNRSIESERATEATLKNDNGLVAPTTDEP